MTGASAMTVSASIVANATKDAGANARKSRENWLNRLYIKGFFCVGNYKGNNQNLLAAYKETPNIFLFGDFLCSRHCFVRSIYPDFDEEFF